MNYLSQMLASGPTLKAQPEKFQTRSPNRYTPEAIAKQVATMKRKRHDKWRRYFGELTDMKASTNQLAKVAHHSPRVILTAMAGLEDEYPPAVKREGTIPCSGNGRDQIVWQWILD